MYAGCEQLVRAALDYFYFYLGIICQCARSLLHPAISRPLTPNKASRHAPTPNPPNASLTQQTETHLSALFAATQNTSLSSWTVTPSFTLPALAVGSPAAASTLISLEMDCVAARRTRPKSSSVLPGKE
jgi:hypothetical protein